MNTYFISDHHFYHRNIIEYTTRDFGTVDGMNNFIVKEHNKIVSKGDIVYCLGDFCWANKSKYTEMVQRLNGRLRLIAGNHDRSHSYKWLSDCGFDRVSINPIILDNFYIVSHEPVFVSNNMPYVNIHGHMHDHAYESNQYINVCVERLNYKPITFEDIIKQVKE